jgi:hypothetical protein
MAPVEIDLSGVKPAATRYAELVGARILRVDWGWFQLYVQPRCHAGWFRLFGWGFGVADHRIDRPLFSERYNGRHGVKRRRYIHVGPLCLRSLR